MGSISQSVGRLSSHGLTVFTITYLMQKGVPEIPDLDDDHYQSQSLAFMHEEILRDFPCVFPE
jgi:hypothetical protein